MVRLFSTRSEDLAGLPANAESYAKPHPNVRLFEPWPEPPAGYKIRAYSLDTASRKGSGLSVSLFFSCMRMS
jgi:hypothetical protein